MFDLSLGAYICRGDGAAAASVRINQTMLYKHPSKAKLGNYQHVYWFFTQLVPINLSIIIKYGNPRDVKNC